MSRIGNLPIPLPDGVSVSISEDHVVTANGPKGEMTLTLDPDLSVEENEDGELVVSRPTEQKRHKALHGLNRALLANVVTGVHEGFKKELEIIGVGYRAEVKNGVLELALGFSHPIYFLPPEGITITAESQRGQNPRVTVEGIDRQLVGQVTSKIRSLRPPEPYKGKGVRIVGEYVRRKAGKTAAR